MFESANSLVRRAEEKVSELERKDRDPSRVRRLRGLLRDAAFSPSPADGQLLPDDYFIRGDIEKAAALTEDSPGKHHLSRMRVARRVVFATVPAVWLLCWFHASGGFLRAAFIASIIAGWGVTSGIVAAWIPPWAALRLLFPVTPPGSSAPANRGQEPSAGWAFGITGGVALSAALGFFYAVGLVRPARGDDSDWVVVICVALSHGFGLLVGGFFLLLELSMHARRRSMLRDVIRRADELLVAVDGPGGRAGGTSRHQTAGGANVATDASSEHGEDAGDPLPPHVAALARVLGHLAKADGRVTPSEIDCAETIVLLLGLDDRGRGAFVRAFGDGKRTTDLPGDLAVLRAYCDEDEDRASELMVRLLSMAHADGHVGPEEAEVLAAAEDAIGGGPSNLAGLVEGLNESSPYAALGLTPPCTREEAKRAHRRKAAELHPDKLRHQNLPEEMRSFAEARYKAVNEAYETIKGDLG